MATYKWPSTGSHRPVDAVQHATCLKTEFDSVSNAANASLSNTSRLPSGLESRISIGITKGIAEARSNGFCPKWSEIDKSIFSKVMLKNITNEASLEARDRVPLPQFNGLHESYNALHTKLITPILPTATTHQLGGAGAATEATSVIDLVNAAQKTGKEKDRARTPTNQQKEEIEDGNDEESGEDTDEDEEDEMDESEDATNDQKIMGDGDSMSGDDASEEASSDDGSSSEDGSETDSDTGSEEEESQGNVREAGVLTIQRDESGFSLGGILKIRHQVSVNKLEAMTSREFSNCLSSPLENFLREQQLAPRIAHIFIYKLLDDGNIMFSISAEKRQVLQHIVDSGRFSRRLERDLFGPSVSTYDVAMSKVDIRMLSFENRKEKSAIIRQLADANPAIREVNGVQPMIGNICWSRKSLGRLERVLIVKFLDPEQATQALVHGLYWKTERHGCERADHSRTIVRCSNCQDYGHRYTECSAPIRCGKCAEQHPTVTCTSRRVKCASCGGGHFAGRRKCPAKRKARKDLGFLNEAASQATRSTTKAQVTPPKPVRQSIPVARTQTEASIPSPVSLDANSAEDEVKSESDQSLPQVDPTQDDHPDTVTLLEKIEDLRKIVLARESALQATSSGRTKRRAGEAFAGGAEAESSDMTTKRIKREKPTREGSMGLYRQPSPFIVNRPQ